MEIILRLAIDKYVRTGQLARIRDACEKLVADDGVAQILDSISDEQDWRNKYYWTEECE